MKGHNEIWRSFLRSRLKTIGEKLSSSDIDQRDRDELHSEQMAILRMMDRSYVTGC